MRPVVKICGLTRVEDVNLCVRLGADILGFVVEYPRPVPWNLDAQTAKGLIEAARGRAETCIVTGGAPERVISLARETGADCVQLHCDETPAQAACIVKALGDKARVVKALYPDTPDLAKTAAAFEAAGVYALLLDPRVPSRAHDGGAADLSAWRELRDAASCPVILAGGIAPENVASMIRQTGARYIDLMSGVESSPGIKDASKLEALFRALSAEEAIPLTPSSDRRTRTRPKV